MDFRDVLLWAEYPEEAKVLFKYGPNLTEQQREELSRILGSRPRPAGRVATQV